MRLGVLAIVLCAGVSTAWAQDVEGLIAPMPEAPPQAVKAELRADGLLGLSESGAVVWTVPHASLRDGLTRSPPVVVVPDHAIYAVRGDLLRVALTSGVVVDRVRFPAVIDDLQLAKDGKLEVRLRDVTRGGASVDVIRYTPGAPAPGRATTDAAPWSSSWRDAVLLVPGWDAAKSIEPDQVSPDVRDLALDALGAAIERDPTNPHYLLLRARLLRAADRDAEAADAFLASGTVRGAPWTDTLHVWSKLEDLGEAAAADVAFTHALDGMKAAGVRPDRQRGLIVVAAYAPRAALDAAIDAGDAARTDVLATRMWQLAPRVEGGRIVWGALAAWMDAHERKDLGDTWRGRAAEGGTFGVGPAPVDLDAWAAMAAAFLAAIPLVALLIGLRRGAQSRTTPAQFPFIQLVDLVALLLPLVPAIYGQLRVHDAVAAIGRSASAPIALRADAVDAETVTFVERELPDSAAQDRVLAYLKAELDALRGGGRSDAEPFDIDTTLTAAITAPDPPGTRARRVDDGFEELAGDQAVWTPSMPEALGLALVLFAIGFAIARRLPGARVLARIVPGGAGPLWALGGLVTGALLAAIYHFAWDPWMGAVAAPRLDALFGLGHLPEVPAAARPTPWWPFAALGAAFAAQATAAWLELRRGA